MSNSIPLGVEQHNPLCIRAIPIYPWEGLADPPASNGFCNFISNVFGFRAGAIDLITWFDKLQLDTVSKIINRQAPSSENNTSAYIQRVCSITGFGPDEVIKPKTYQHAYKLLYAMTTVEQGSFELYFKKWELDDGLRRAGIEDVPQTPLHKNISAVGGTLASVGTASKAVVDAYHDNQSLFQMANFPALLICLVAGAIVINEIVNYKRG